MEAKNRFADDIDWYLDHLRAERGASPHTISSYSRDLNQAARFFESCHLNGWQDIAEQDLVAFQTYAAKEVKATTLRRRISALRSLLKFLKKNSHGPQADLPSAAVVRLPKRLPKSLKWEELVSLLEQPDLSSPAGLRDRTILELIYGTGLRVSEVVGLCRDEIDLTASVFRVTGKRGKTRVVPVPRQTKPWIERYLSESRPKLVKKPVANLFLGVRGGPFSRQSIFDVIEKLRIEAGITKKISPHTLRHTFAVHLVQGGADLRVVQELLGHSSISTTQVYTQLDLETVRGNYNKAHPRK